MPDMVNSVAFVNPDDGAAVEYDGPFECTRDGGHAEITIPTDPDDYAGIHEGTADRLTDRVGDIGVALADGGIEVSGIIAAADRIEAGLVVRIDDGAFADPADVDIDRGTIDDA